MYHVELRTIDPQPALALRRSVRDTEIPAFMQQAIPQAIALAERHGADVKSVYARYFTMGPTFDAEAGVVLDRAVEGEGEVRATGLPGGDVAYVMHVGPYEAMHAAYAALEQWMAANNRVAGAGPWEVYLSDPQQEPDPQKWRTEIYWPLA